MGKPKRKKKKPSGGRPSTPNPDAVIREIEDQRPTLSAERVGPEWGVIQRLLVKAGSDTSNVARAVASRDLDLIDHLIAKIKDPSLEMPTEAPDDADDPDVPEEVLRDAMRAYRKRVKLTKLDHESKLARSPLSSGKDADFDAIIPPNQFPPEVWRALARRGELESTGQGFYKIPLQRRAF